MESSSMFNSRILKSIFMNLKDYVHQTFKQMWFIITHHLEFISEEIFSETEMPGGVLQTQAHKQEFRTSCVQLLDCEMKEMCISLDLSTHIFFLS